MSINSRLMRGAAYVTSASIMGRVSTFAANLVVLRILGTTLVGEWGLIESWLSIATMFSLFGIGIATTKFVSEYVETDPSRSGAVATASVVLALGTGVLVAAIAYLCLALQVLSRWPTVQATLAHHAVVFCFLILAGTYREVASSLVYGFQEFRSLVGVNAAIGLTGFPLLCLLSWWRALDGVLVARFVLVCIEALFLSRAVRRSMAGKGITPSFDGFWMNARQLSRFSLPTFIGHLGGNPVQTFLTSFLASQRGGLSQLGILTVAGRLTSFASFLPATMVPTIIPLLSSEWVKDDKETFRQGILFAMRAFWLVTLPIVVFFACACPTLIVRLYGDQYRPGWPVAFVLLVIALLSLPNEACDRTFTATGRVWLSSANNYVWAVLFVIAGVFLVPRAGAVGYVDAFLLSFALYAALQLWWLRRLFAVDLRFLGPMLGVSGTALVLAWAGAEWLTPLWQVLLAFVLTATTVVAEFRLLLDLKSRNAIRRRGHELAISGTGVWHRVFSRRRT